MIKGWAEGLSDMRVGGERILYLPADLAYGARSPSEMIPANSALVFEVELLAIADPNSPPAGEKDEL